jgi:hypothetical protein
MRERTAADAPPSTGQSTTPRGADQQEQHYTAWPITLRQGVDPTPKAGVAGSNPVESTEKHLVINPSVRRTGGPSQSRPEIQELEFDQVPQVVETEATDRPLSKGSCLEVAYAQRRLLLLWCPGSSAARANTSCPHHVVSSWPRSLVDRATLVGAQCRQGVGNCRFGN